MPFQRFEHRTSDIHIVNFNKGWVSPSFAFIKDKASFLWHVLNLLLTLAEDVGFEPTGHNCDLRLSKPLHSTTLPIFLEFGEGSRSRTYNVNLSEQIYSLPQHHRRCRPFVWCERRDSNSHFMTSKDIASARWATLVLAILFRLSASGRINSSHTFSASVVRCILVTA